MRSKRTAAMKLKDESKVFHEIVEKNHSFVILVHRYPEGDAIGSQLALGLMLNNHGKKVDMLNYDPLPWQYKFLPGCNLIKVTNNFEKDYDVGIILDCSDFERTNFSSDDKSRIKNLINIDHHLSNSYFGDINIIDPHASSTGEMVYNLSENMNFELDQNIALNIYTAIITDTGSFRYSNTTSETLLIASRLVKIGIDVAWTNENLFEIGTVGKLKLWGEALSKIELECNNLISILIVTEDMFRQSNAEFSDTENLINNGLSIIGVEVSLLFNELSTDLYKVSFRSKGKINVAKVAAIFGGGGHFRASGCKISGVLDQVKNRVINVLENELLSNELLKDKVELQK
ncbi:bifunctional oligoribonuclease/PAP phosphatase NrnA [bacterium]|nr:bifunctional oligoribonuclease/PAP phosphatase NrnA [bacterium]